MFAVYFSSSSSSTEEHFPAVPSLTTRGRHTAAGIKLVKILHDASVGSGQTRPGPEGPGPLMDPQSGFHLAFLRQVLTFMRRTKEPACKSKRRVFFHH